MCGGAHDLMVHVSRHSASVISVGRCSSVPIS